MTAVRNTARERLEAGQLALGLGVRQARTVDIGKIAKTTGFDWLFIDCEHNSMSVDTAVQISVAAYDAGITPIVRVPAMELTLATRVLDGGAMGIVMPHVDTPEEAKEIVSKLKYPPMGHRSIAGALAAYDFAPVEFTKLVSEINAATTIVVMLETPTAIANAEAIAAVPGIDVLLIGASDLSLEMGIPGQLGHPDMAKAFETAYAACQKHGKYLGMGGVYVEDLMRKYVGVGARMILSGSDLSLFMAGGAQRTGFLRSCLS